MQEPAPILDRREKEEAWWKPLSTCFGIGDPEKSKNAFRALDGDDRFSFFH